MKIILARMAGVIVVKLGLAAILGWFLALLWNHFPFLDTLHHMSLWDGILLHLLCSLLFKSVLSSGSE
jgi:hypothetical protein